MLQYIKEAFSMLASERSAACILQYEKTVFPSFSFDSFALSALQNLKMVFFSVHLEKVAKSRIQCVKAVSVKQLSSISISSMSQSENEQFVRFLHSIICDSNIPHSENDVLLRLQSISHKFLMRPCRKEDLSMVHSSNAAGMRQCEKDEFSMLHF